MIHDEVLNFHDWILCYHEPFHDKKKTKSIGITNESVILKYYENDLDTSNTSFAELCFPWIDSFAFMKSKSNGPLLKILHENL